jgi:hypothetical protein
MDENDALELLKFSEWLPNIVRDDEFWRALENMPPSEREKAVRARFLSAIPSNELPEVVKAYAGLAAITVTLVERLGPMGARERLRRKPN